MYFSLFKFQGDFLIKKEQNLHCKIYFQKKQLLWEFNDEILKINVVTSPTSRTRPNSPKKRPLKRKIETKFSDILSIDLVGEDNDIQMIIQTNVQLTLLKERTPIAHKNTQWAKSTEDFTSEKKLIC